MTKYICLEENIIVEARFLDYDLHKEKCNKMICVNCGSDVKTIQVIEVYE